MRNSFMPGLNTRQLWWSLLLILSCLSRTPTRAASDDLWDISGGTVVTANSPLNAVGDYDARDIFGGTFGAQPFPSERGNIIFSDAQTNSFVHFVDWRTPSPVIVRSFKLYAYGDGASGNREFQTFTLKAKSPGSPTFDLTLFTFTPTHPYRFTQGIDRFLLQANVPKTAASEFRVEFVQYRFGPRIAEIDGFSGPLATVYPAVEITWPSETNVAYQIQWTSEAVSNVWLDLGMPIPGDGTTNTLLDSTRNASQKFYRILTVE
ncbi:MAG TPA: hypothetical protein VJ063_14905 [Verrucomicrobiae bacterium]|nr:hypothetical protein [Verrucomicrobiae bacterium]